MNWRWVFYVLMLLIVVTAIWLFVMRPALACWARDGIVVRGFADNVECMERTR